jgi:hypothetical protein
MRQVIFKLATLDTAPSSEITFIAPFQVVDIVIRKPDNYGLTAGLEGLGCEFISDISGSLCAISLDMNPYGLVDTTPTELLDPIIRHIRSHSTPGELILANTPRIELIADAVWLCQPFGTGIWSFDNLVIEPLEHFEGFTEQTIYVEVCKGVFIGVRQDTGALRCVLVEGFNHHQQILGTIVSTETAGEMFMKQLNLIHWNYYVDPELPEDMPNPIENILLDPSLPELLRKLIGVYIESLSEHYDGEEASGYE